MSYSIKKVPDAPIVTLLQEARPAMAEMSQMLDTLTALLDAQSEPVFLVMDVQGPAFAIDDMSIAASLIARRQSALLLHKNVRETLLVTRSGSAKLAVLGLSTAVFGQVKIRRFDSPEQALAYCRTHLALPVDRSGPVAGPHLWG